MNTSSLKVPSLELKRYNRNNIYSLLRENRELSRQSIVTGLGLSLPTVVQNLNKLLEDGLIREAGMQSNTGGRKAKTYAIIANARTAIGLDISRNHVVAVAINLRGEIIGNLRVKLVFSQTPEYYSRIGKLVDELIYAANIDPSSILGVGISIPGLISADLSTSYYCRVLEVDRLTREEFAPYIPYPIHLYHDAIASAFAESWQNKKDKTFFYMFLSYSIGGAILIDSSVYPGCNHRSAEIGHMKLVANGRQCYCGKRGCMDPYCSAKALIGISDGDLKEFFYLLHQHHKQAQLVWEEYLCNLSLAIHNIRMLFDCNIVLGGRIGEELDQYLDVLREKVALLDPFSDNADFLSVCTFKTESAAVGSALHFIEQYVSEI